MNIVDQAILERLEAGGMWVPSLHEDDEDAAPADPDALVVHDGLVEVDTSTKVVSYPVPYVVFHSSLGDDPESESNERLTGRRGRRSVFFTMTYVGEDRHQSKWAGQQVRDQLAGHRLVVPAHRSWPVVVEESQRVRRDDDAVQPNGAPLFYGVDNYAASITLTPREATP